MTIQEVLESRLEVMLGNAVAVRASGRTDAGVHAKYQVVNFYSKTRLKPAEISRGLNSLLPADIVVLAAEEVPDSFHARFSAESKVYEYLILNREVPSALERNFSWHIRQPLALEPMTECLQHILGVHDFSAFMGAGSSVRSTERQLYNAEIVSPDRDHLMFIFEANGFLRHMVRNLVGTLVEAGKRKIGTREFAAILASRDRCRAGMTAPAHGLYLAHVKYC